MMTKSSLFGWVGLLSLLGGCVDTTPTQPQETSSETTGLKLSVDTGKALGDISPLIYGINGEDCEQGDVAYTACRLGGNRWTAYNWENNLSNAGRDWCYQNDEFLGQQTDPPGAAATQILAHAEDSGAAVLLTVPLVDYVAGVSTGHLPGPPACEGDVRKQSETYLEEYFKQNVAAKDGELSLEPDLDDEFVFQDEFVASVRDRAASTRVIFSLDNEPDLWASTHPEVRPGGFSGRLTYSELTERSIEFATAIRGAWPEAEINSFAGGGYQAAMTLQNASDSEQHGVFLDYFLDRMREAEESGGQRLIDYVDLHWYPEIRVAGAEGEQEARITEAATFPEIVEARVQAPRSLWDETFIEDSWLMDAFGQKPLRLLRWLEERIAAHYPGTKLAVTEYHYGAGQDVSGAIAQADVLGIFGREGVALATLWPHQASEPYVAAAFRAYLDYDRQGSRFGDVAISATSSDDEIAAVHASYSSEDPSRVVIVAINRSPLEQFTTVEITSEFDYARARVYRITADIADLVESNSLTATSDGDFEYLMPGHSVSVLALDP